MTNTNRPIRRALVSVFHKEGIEVLAEAFIKAGTEVVSTGSTAKRLAELGVAVTEVSEVTGFPECLDGRVKTLDPHIHAGILADMTNSDHAAQLEKFGIKPFDLVVVNLYPFADTVRSGADEAAVIEKIDIGGPSMVRGAAKNSATVAIVTDPADYALVAARVANGEGFSLEERRWLAGKAFAHTAAYDATINEWTAKHWPKPATVESADPAEGENPVNEAKFPATFTRTWDRAHTLRYGENSHQQAALYLDPLDRDGFAHAEQLGGKPMSYNNYVDADAAWRAVWDMAPAIAVAVVKHNNPCGLAIGATAAEAHKKAHACDPVSAYGGVIACNTTVTLEMAESVRPIFTEVIVAPAYEDAALELLKTKKKNLRILKTAACSCRTWTSSMPPATIRTHGSSWPANPPMRPRSRTSCSPGAPSAASSPTLSCSRTTRPRSASVWARSTAWTPAIWPSIAPTRWPTAPIAPPVRSLRPTRSSRSQMAPRR